MAITPTTPSTQWAPNRAASKFADACPDLALSDISTSSWPNEVSIPD